MFTDIAGYTALMSKDEQKTLQLLQKNRDMQKSLVTKHNGEFLKEIGDGTLLCFQSALDAVRCAMEIQKFVKDDPNLNFRIGIHLGDIIFKEGDVFGDGVNVASRIEALAKAGGICISEEVFRSVRNQPGVQAHCIGEKHLKNVDQPIKIYSLIPLDSPLKRTGFKKQLKEIHISIKTAGIMVLLLVVAFALYRFLSRDSNSMIASIAVLPLESLSSDSDQEYFVDGMTDAIIAELAQIGALRVISRTSVMQYKEDRKSLPEIAGELKVDALVEGTVSHVGDEVSISVKLIRANPEEHLWSSKYRRDLRDILNLQEEVARSIAREINVTVTQDERIRLTSAQPVDPEAYRLYLKGRFYWNMRSPAELQNSQIYFHRAIEKDSTFALAYAGISDYFIISGFYAWLSPKDAFPRAKAAVLKALEIDPTLAEAHSSLAYIKMLYEWDWKGAETEFQKAIELNPNYAVAHQWYGEFLNAMRRHEEAIREVKRAQELDPFSAIVKTQLAGCYLSMRQIEQAIEIYNSVLDLEPDFQIAYFFRAYAYSLLGRHEEAISIALHLWEISDDSVPGMLIPLGYAYAMAGEDDKARKVLEKLIQFSKQAYVSPMGVAVIYGALGEIDAAYEWLEKAFESRDHWLVQIRSNPIFDVFHSDARMNDLLKKMGLEK
ncbi:MAG: tetratricopeptide repeat protein [bacterium]